MSKREKKEYFLPYIYSLLSQRVKPTMYQYMREDGDGSRVCYVLGNLPNNRILIYENSALFVVNGFGDEERGYFNYESGCVYMANSFKKFLGRGLVMSEREVVLEARNVIKAFKTQYTVKFSKALHL